MRQTGAGVVDSPLLPDSLSPKTQPPRVSTIAYIVPRVKQNGAAKWGGDEQDSCCRAMMDGSDDEVQLWMSSILSSPSK